MIVFYYIIENAVPGKKVTNVRVPVLAKEEKFIFN